MVPVPAGYNTAMAWARRLAEAFDRFQQRHGWLGFPIAVFKKFGDDQAGNHAALIAYYGFFSLFPLLLVLVTLLELALRGNEQLQERLLGTALAQFPIVGDLIRENVQALGGSLVALVVGLAAALWGGLGVAGAVQDALNSVWNVPRKRYPNLLAKRVRGLLWLAGLSFVLLVTALLAGVGVTGHSPAGIAATLALNGLVFLLAFRVLTVANVPLRALVPGAAVASVGWTLLQALAGLLVGRQLRQSSELYGIFGVVMGLLTWLYLAAQLTLVAAEANVVWARRLWPRKLLPPPLARADQEVLVALAKEEERLPQEQVQVTFQQEAGGSVPGPAGPGADRPGPPAK